MWMNAAGRGEVVTVAPIVSPVKMAFSQKREVPFLRVLTCSSLDFGADTVGAALRYELVICLE